MKQQQIYVNFHKHILIQALKKICLNINTHKKTSHHKMTCFYLIKHYAHEHPIDYMEFQFQPHQIFPLPYLANQNKHPNNTYSQSKP